MSSRPVSRKKFSSQNRSRKQFQKSILIICINFSTRSMPLNLSENVHKEKSHFHLVKTKKSMRKNVWVIKKSVKDELSVYLVCFQFSYIIGLGIDSSIYLHANCPLSWFYTQFPRYTVSYSCLWVISLKYHSQKTWYRCSKDTHAVSFSLSSIIFLNERPNLLTFFVNLRVLRVLTHYRTLTQ